MFAAGKDSMEKVDKKDIIDKIIKLIKNKYKLMFSDLKRNFDKKTLDDHFKDNPVYEADIIKLFRIIYCNEEKRYDFNMVRLDGHKYKKIPSEVGNDFIDYFFSDRKWFVLRQALLELSFYYYIKTGRLIEVAYLQDVFLEKFIKTINKSPNDFKIENEYFIDKYSLHEFEVMLTDYFYEDNDNSLSRLNKALKSENPSNAYLGNPINPRYYLELARASVINSLYWIDKYHKNNEDPVYNYNNFKLIKWNMFSFYNKEEPQDRFYELAYAQTILLNENVLVKMADINRAALMAYYKIFQMSEKNGEDINDVYNKLNEKSSEATNIIRSPLDLFMLYLDSIEKSIEEMIFKYNEDLKK